MLWVVLLIFLTSIVQSVFGLGILVFGTPILVLLDYSFAQILSILLPCSMIINLLQIFKGRGSDPVLRRRFLVFSLPGIVIGSVLALTGTLALSLGLVIGVMLIFTAGLRIVPPMKAMLHRVAEKSESPSLAGIGFIHGLTNMGGGLLTTYVNALYDDKHQVRDNIAFGYFFMAGAQLLALVALGRFYFEPMMSVLPIIAAGTYLLIGERLFRLSSEKVYEHVMTAFIVILGIMLILI